MSVRITGACVCVYTESLRNEWLPHDGTEIIVQTSNEEGISPGKVANGSDPREISLHQCCPTRSRIHAYYT